MSDHLLRPLSELALLTLDLGQVTGFAYGRFTARWPRPGRWELPAVDRRDVIGARTAALDNTLAAALDRWSDVVVVAIPEAFPGRNQFDVAASGALHGVVRAECWRRGIKLLVQPEGTVRKEMLGRGSGPSVVMKSLALAWCARAGVTVGDHNEADAVVFWRWCRDEIARQRIEFIERTKSHVAQATGPPPSSLRSVAEGS